MEIYSTHVPFLTTDEYFQLIEETSFHLADLRGFKNCALTEDWHQAKLRVLNVISDLGVQFDENTRFRR